MFPIATVRIAGMLRIKLEVGGWMISPTLLVKRSQSFDPASPGSTAPLSVTYLGLVVGRGFALLADMVKCWQIFSILAFLSFFKPSKYRKQWFLLHSHLRSFPTRLLLWQSAHEASNKWLPWGIPSQAFLPWHPLSSGQSSCLMQVFWHVMKLQVF